MSSLVARLNCLKQDILRPFPEHETTQGGEIFLAFDHGEEMVAGQLTHFASETGTAIGEEDLGFAVATGIKKNIPA